MKMTKKIMSLAIVFAMVMAMSVSVFAAQGTGTITVQDAIKGETYSIYKVFDATYSGDNVSYTFTKTADNTALFTALEGVFTMTASATNANVYNVALKDGKGIDDIITVLKANIANMTKAATDVTAETTTVEFKNLDYGYYFIDSTTGSLVTIDSNLPDATVYEKNSIPTIVKKVQEDSNNAWVDVATADIGQIVNFKLTVNTGSNSHNDIAGNGVDADYVIVDTLPAGLIVNEASYAIEGWTKGTDYTVTVNGQAVTITLKASKVSKLGENADIVITYNATVDTDAVIAGDNINNVTLTYKQQTVSDSANVKTYKLTVFKYTGTDTPLATAEFVLKKTVDNATVYAKTSAAVVDTETNNNVYTFVEWVANEAQATTFVSPANGKFEVVGLDVDSYALEETKAPNGYNILTADETFAITEGNVEESVQNNAGTELPSTGGIGTTIFYALGGLMAVGAGVLLVAKKRMEA